MRYPCIIGLAFVETAIAVAYDYVVLGGGIGGLTVASRLAEDKSVTVAVIEAGYNVEDLPEVFVPGLLGSGQSFTTLDWAYKTVSQQNLDDRVITIHAGKALGGSSVINAMLFPRASSHQYDAWALLNKDSSWNWSSLLSYFKRSEQFTPPDSFQTNVGGIRFQPEFHGVHGRVKVGFPNFFFEQSKLWRQAAIQLGFPSSLDLANGDPHGVGVSPETLNVSNNTRCSATCAYYTPFANEPNFNVITNATVTRILWNHPSASTDSQAPLVASSVEYITKNETHRVDIVKNVILAAGTVGSPKILELSGVGNLTILRAVGVDPVFDLPSVGENLADHVHSWATAFTNTSLTFDSLLANPSFFAEQQALWFKNHTGMLSSFPGSLGLAAPSDIFPKTQLANLLQEARSNLKKYAQSFSNGNPQLARGIEAQHTIALDLYQNNEALPLELNLFPGYNGPSSSAARPQRNYTSINNVLYAPLSRGRTHIATSDPASPPAIDPAYLTHPLDTAALVAGIKLARKMLTTAPMDSIYAGEFEPGAGIDNDEKIEAWLRGVATSDNHETGTLAMLPREMGGVVDTRLKVYGTANVRVVDASIIPFPVSAHMSSTIYMIGEHAADIIKSDMQ